jgi:hypothetical protein
MGQQGSETVGHLGNGPLRSWDFGAVSSGTVRQRQNIEQKGSEAVTWAS